jgi:hypothetical protein
MAIANPEVPMRDATAVCWEEDAMNELTIALHIVVFCLAVALGRHLGALP